MTLPLTITGGGRVHPFRLGETLADGTFDPFPDEYATAPEAWEARRALLRSAEAATINNLKHGA